MRCAVLGCQTDNQSKKFNNGFMFFRFPTDHNLMKQWVNACKRGDKINVKNARVCSRHFDKESYQRNLKYELLGYSAKNHRLLKPEAIPSLNLTVREARKVNGDKGRNDNSITDIFEANTSYKKMEPIILVHGGAGDIPDSRVQPKIDGNKKSVEAGYKILQKGGSALDAVEAAVKVMEDDEAFNAGYGSVLNLDGEVEMDAIVMVGSDLKAGAVTVVKDIAHPISLARLVMENTPHVLLAGAGANKFAAEQGIPKVPRDSLVSPFAQKALEEFKKRKDNRTEIGEKNPGEVGTVGAVAIDKNGNLAAATSTGGINGKMVGRSSDTSLIGSGAYADDHIGAVSTTGHGETIAKYCLAHAIIKDMEYGKKTANDATNNILEKMTSRLKNTAGAITLSKTGEVGIGFTSQRMSWAYRKGNEIHYGVNKDQHEVVKVK